MTRNVMIVSLAALLLNGCGGEKKAETAERAPEVRSVQVGQVETRALENSLRASGLLVPREEAAVSPELAGFQVSRVYVEPGAFVRAGQPLLQLDPLLIQAQVTQAEAQVEQQNVALGRAQREAARVVGLDEEGVLSAEAVDQRVAEVEASQALLRVARAQLAEVRNRRARLTLRAPVSGVVIERNIRPGDVAGATQGAAFRIARGGLVELDAEVPESDLSLLRAGDAAQVRLADGSSIPGTVRLITPAVDPQTRLGRIRVLLGQASAARFGGFAEATFQSAASPVKAVPEAAIRFESAGAAITVVGPDNRVRKTRVRTGRRGGGWVEILEGPPAGSRVVLSGAAFLLDGDRIRAVRAVAAPSRSGAQHRTAAPTPPRSASQ